MHYDCNVILWDDFSKGKTAHQAEIDCTCELIDFYRAAVEGAVQVNQIQPPLHSTGVWNRLEYRGLEGFIASISPFNFTAIGNANRCMYQCSLFQNTMKFARLILLQ